YSRYALRSQQPRSAPQTPASPPTERVIAVLELLAGCDEGLRLADVVRQLGLTRGTAHALVSTLAEHGWVTRDPLDKTLRLGPAFSSLSALAGAGRIRARAARTAGDLAGELGYAVTVTERIGPMLVITAFEGHLASPHVAIGDRVPYAAPIGPAFAAWEPRDAQREWMDRSVGANPKLAASLEQFLARTRRRGFSVERMTPSLSQAGPLISMLRGEALAEPVYRATTELLSEITAVVLLPEARQRRARDLHSRARVRQPRRRRAEPGRAPVSGAVAAGRHGDRPPSG